jgi:hypothetical protein
MAKAKHKWLHCCFAIISLLIRMAESVKEEIANTSWHLSFLCVVLDFFLKEPPVISLCVPSVYSFPLS